MSRKAFCGSPEHGLSRRSFLGTLTAAGAGAVANMTALHALGAPDVANELRRNQKACILLWLAGGSSQLETFDPKPGTATGGPFQAIQTTVPGIHISELMPKLAGRMKDTCIIRSLNTRNADHGGAAKLMMRGRPGEAAVDFPDLGAVIARELAPNKSQVPDYVSYYFATEGRMMAPGSPGFMGARFGSTDLYSSMIPENIRRAGVSEQDHRERAQLRDLFSKQFEHGRTSGSVESHRQAYERVSGIMANESLFDVSKEPQRLRDQYGPTLFGQQALGARRLVEAGVPFVRVARAWWDSHSQNFESHQEMVPELDHVMTTLLDDLSQRGLLDSTLVVTLAEFGRTPQINATLGRDHFASAWSCTLSGCGIKGGVVYGRTDATGNRVVEGEMNAARLMATIYRALGINPRKNYYLGARPVPLTEPGTQPVLEVLA
ncbi:MAG TPA: DUF1501 domain-containing protein [Gemmataceae bacterium]|jgi:hypothetical protein|nr:DUF1501 domain-containing protein [Gemmataceae bacterium]